MLSQATPSVALSREPEPRLFDFGKPIPGGNESRSYSPLNRSISQEAKVFDDLVVEPSIARLVAVEEKEGVDEEWKVREEGNVEGTVLLQGAWRDSEVICEEKIHLLSVRTELVRVNWK
jgi:hypothetical protein